ncbi:Vms1/Ankzf1 family peptidyl-tRNA hydrolase [Natrialbaceae archaeon GCM10025810]|uniref:Vms1/Ankzf1 family peptidyl-tRNA hydrolase n=1 Tax=Halovalidus salilacus TaxID=3075124 RepID=UPI0036117406
MIDELLGRASLKERIDELEEETERLERRYEAEAERRAEAVREKQSVEEERNRLEDRIAQLEGELDRLQGGAAGVDDAEGLAVRRRERLRGARLEEVLVRLESFRTGPEGALTAVVDADGEVPEAVGDALGERAALVADAAPCLVCLDDAGLIATTLEPPITPTLEGDGSTSRSGASAFASGAVWSDRFRLEREWFLPTAQGRYALALVRADVFALGVYEGGERVDYRGFESDVKGSHSKGGFSQARFERIRDGQIDAHLERARKAIEGVETDDRERLFLVGQRGVVDSLADELAREPDAVAAVDATGKPEPALEDAHRSFFTTELRVV